MKIYLWKSCDKSRVIFHTDLKEAAKEGYTTKPDLTIEEQEWYDNDSTAYIKDDKIILGKTPSEKANEEASKKRYLRDQRLAESDKYMLPDYPISVAYKNKIKAYREALRVLPEDDNWPYVDLPDFPTE